MSCGKIHVLRSCTGSTPSHPAHADAATAVEDALILLRTGRLTMALRALEGVPERIQKELTAAGSLGWLQGYGAGGATGREKGWRYGFAEGVRAASLPPRPVADLERLARLCASREGRDLARAELKITDRDLDAILAGKAGLSASAWKRLWQEARGRGVAGHATDPNGSERS